MIHILSPEVCNQIAAGEVVERPASVVKELLENSIDSGATEITLRLIRGGKDLIELGDNGCGMNESDSEKCFLRHATSKISKIEDIFNLRSFGFRGEALGAIASISECELLTREKGEKPATKIKLKEGIIIEKGIGSRPQGTTLTVKNLFCGVPVRKAYLRSDDTEYRACFRVIIQAALSFPRLGIRVEKDNTEVLNLAPTENILDRITQITRSEALDWKKVEFQTPAGKLTGFVSSPGHFAASKNHQYLFVNHRSIEDHRIAFAVREAYVQSCGIEKHLFPSFVLSLEIDPILVDVNVHPRKLEVKFSDPSEIFSLVKSGVTQSLGNIQYGGDESFSQKTYPQFQNNNAYSGVASARDFQKSLLGAAVFREKYENRSQATFTFQADLKLPKPFSISHSLEDTPLKFLAQIENRYLLAQGPDGLYIFEQHALHERQRFDRFMAQVEKKEVPMQTLLIPQEINLSEEELSLIQEHKEAIECLGFRISENPLHPPFQGGTDHPPLDKGGLGGIYVRSLPQLLQDKNLEQIFQSLAEYFKNHQVGENILESLLRKQLEYKACRGSVMFGDALTPEEGQQLLDDFQKSKWRDLCPHGRPNHVLFRSEEIEKWFHR